jgi:GntR family transcriptional regulator
MADPMYRQIAEDLRRQIEDGELAPGQQLRTELELREKYDASRNTVRDAIKWLITRGLVETRPGQGTFVVEKIEPYVTTLSDPDTGGSGEVGVYEAEAMRRRKASSSAVRLEIQEANDQMIGELALPEGATVVSRHQRRFIDGTPWSMQTSFYPLTLVERGATDLLRAPNIDKGTMAYLHETLGIEQAGWRDTITVRAPDEAEVRFFRLPDDGRVPVIETRRTAFDRDDIAVRVTVSVYPADRNQFAINVGKARGEVAGPSSAPANQPHGELKASVDTELERDR